MTIEDRAYQNKCLEAVTRAQAQGSTRQLVVMATGLGKTIVISKLLQQRGLPRTFGFMHREELIGQAVDKIQKLSPDARIGIEKAGQYADPASDQVVLASVLTVGRQDRKRLSRFPADWPEVIWVDEAHHAPAGSYLETLDHFGVYGEAPRRNCLFLGTTATPDRLDEMGYDKIFDDVVFRYDLREAIADRWLADVHAWRVKNDLDLSKVRTRAGDFVEKDLAEAVKDSEINQVAVQTWEEKCRGRRSLFFCVTKAHAREVTAALKDAGARAAAIVDDTPTKDRKAALQLFQEGEIDALVNVLVLTEGFDAPSTECVHILRPTKSRALYSQMLGRGTRLAPGKKHVEVFDYTGQGHDICSVGSIFGLPDSWVLEGQSVTKDAKQVEDLEADLGLSAEGATGIQGLFARAKSRRFEMIHETITDTGLPSHLAWVRPSRAQERWVIAWRNETRESVGKLKEQYRGQATKAIERKNLWGVHERIVLFRNELGIYEAQLKRHGPADSNTESGKLDSDRSLTKLVARTEDLIRELRPHKLVLLKKTAKWRTQPCSEAQRGILKKKGIPEWFLSKISKGDAGTLMAIPSTTLKKWFDGIDEEPMAI